MGARACAGTIYFVLCCVVNTSCVDKLFHYLIYLTNKMLDSVVNFPSLTNNTLDNELESFPLHTSCRDGNVEELKHLLGRIQLNVSMAQLIMFEDDHFRWTPAHFSAYFGKVSTGLLSQVEGNFTLVSVG